MLTNATGKVIREDDILKRARSDRAMHPNLRNPSTTWDILELVKIMTGEVRVRALEEDVGTKMRPTLTNKFTVTSLAANQ
eukprot:12883642-Prorocentrum_lima.AAC.1